MRIPSFSLNFSIEYCKALLALNELCVHSFILRQQIPTIFFLLSWPAYFTRLLCYSACFSYFPAQLWHGTLERMAIGAALAFEFPKFRLLENGYEINGHVSKVVRYTTEPTQNDDHDRMLDEFKQLLTSSWATGIDIESAMIEDEYKIPTAAQPFQSLASGRTKSFGCGMVTCKDNINGQIEYIRVYACIFNGRMTIKDEYDTKRPLYMYDGFNASQKGVDHIETDHIPIADSNLHSFINGRQTN